MQLVTRRVMDEAVKTAFIHGTHASAPLQVQPLKAEEEQALRYVAGYIEQDKDQPLLFGCLPPSIDLGFPEMQILVWCLK